MMNTKTDTTMTDKKIQAFAIHAHESVNHKYDGKPYSVHLELVDHFTKQFIYLVPREDVKYVNPSANLHDTIEDCRLTYNDIKKVAGERVADIVYALSNNKGKTREERADKRYYKEIRKDHLAVFVKLGDRLGNTWYSKQSKGRMFEVYKKENEEFMVKLGRNGNFAIRILNKIAIWFGYTSFTKHRYEPMFIYLENMFKDEDIK